MESGDVLRSWDVLIADLFLSPAHRKATQEPRQDRTRNREGKSGDEEGQEMRKVVEVAGIRIRMVWGKKMVGLFMMSGTKERDVVRWLQWWWWCIYSKISV